MFKNQEDLNEFNKGVQKLYNLLTSLNKVWDNEAYSILTVLVQNLYSTNSEEKRTQILTSIKLLSDYRGKGCYLSTFVCRELNMLINSICYDY